MAGKNLKSNLRSFRYSDEVAAILETQAGSSLNDKFESLVLFCFLRLEERKKDLEQLEQQITQERDRLHKLQHATQELRQLETDLKTTQYYFGIVERRAKQIAEAADL